MKQPEFSALRRCRNTQGGSWRVSRVGPGPFSTGAGMIEMAWPQMCGRCQPTSASKIVAQHDLTDSEGRVWNYMGEIGKSAGALSTDLQTESQAPTALDQALRLRPRLLLNGKLYRLSDADALELALTPLSRP